MKNFHPCYVSNCVRLSSYECSCKSSHTIRVCKKHLNSHISKGGNHGLRNLALEVDQAEITRFRKCQNILKSIFTEDVRSIQHSKQKEIKILHSKILNLHQEMKNKLFEKRKEFKRTFNFFQTIVNNKLIPCCPETNTLIRAKSENESITMKDLGDFLTKSGLKLNDSFRDAMFEDRFVMHRRGSHPCRANAMTPSSSSKALKIDILNLTMDLSRPGLSCKYSEPRLQLTPNSERLRPSSSVTYKRKSEIVQIQESSHTCALYNKKFKRLDTNLKRYELKSIKVADGTKSLMIDFDKILIVGSIYSGISSSIDSNDFSSAAILNLNTGKIKRLRDLNHSRKHSALSWVENCPAVIGGEPNEVSNTVEILKDGVSWEMYKHKRQKETVIPRLNIGRYKHSACFAGDRTFVYGGHGTSCNLHSFEVYSKKQWTICQINLPFLKAGLVWNSMDEKIIIFGQNNRNCLEMYKLDLKTSRLRFMNKKKLSINVDQNMFVQQPNMIICLNDDLEATSLDY